MSLRMIHPATIDFMRMACQRPDMYMLDHDIRQLEMQLYGFDAALAATGALGIHEAFNAHFTELVRTSTGASGSQGWAAALIDTFGPGGPSFNAFCDLLCDLFPVAFQPADFERAQCPTRLAGNRYQEVRRPGR